MIFTSKDIYKLNREQFGKFVRWKLKFRQIQLSKFIPFPQSLTKCHVKVSHISKWT